MGILVALLSIAVVILILFLIGWFCNETGISFVDRNTTVSGFWMIVISKGLLNLFILGIILIAGTCALYLLNDLGKFILTFF